MIDFWWHFSAIGKANSGQFYYFYSGNEFDGFIIFDYFMIGNHCMQTYQTEMQLPVKFNVNGSSFIVISITEYLIKIRNFTYFSTNLLKTKDFFHFRFS